MLNARALQKVRGDEVGTDCVERLLVGAGARTPRNRESGRDWLSHALVQARVRRVRHPGCYRYVYSLDRRVHVPIKPGPYPCPCLPAGPASCRRATEPVPAGMIALVLRVRPCLPNDLDACLGIVRSLPEFFTADAFDTIRRDFGQHHGWAVCDDDEVVGFAIVDRRSSTTAEILWAGVHRDRRGTGIGTFLIEQVLDALTGGGVVLVEAKTLDRSAGYGPYESTRAFWERRGFVQIDRIDPMPGWQPGNPCALYVAALSTTR